MTRRRQPPLAPRPFALALALGTLAAAACGGSGLESTPTPAPTADAIVAPGSAVIKLAGNLQFVEGPIWVPRDGGYLLFSDIPPSTIYRFTSSGLSAWRQPSSKANGNTLDRNGALLTAEHESRQVSITAASGTVTTLVDRHAGKRLNSPNDVAVRSDGSVWFTDPDYGLEGRPKEQAGNYVYRLVPETGALTAVVTDFDEPNGICFSPDGRRLYVADSGGPHHIRAFDVDGAGTLSGGGVFAVIDRGVPDGIRTDEKGRLYSSSGDGVQVFDAQGKLLTRILVPEEAANLTFGGSDYKTLFITARTSLYSVLLTTAGADRR